MPKRFFMNVLVTLFIIKKIKNKKMPKHFFMRVLAPLFIKKNQKQKKR